MYNQNETDKELRPINMIEKKLSDHTDNEVSSENSDILQTAC